MTNENKSKHRRYVFLKNVLKGSMLTKDLTIYSEGINLEALDNANVLKPKKYEAPVLKKIERKTIYK